ncbi:response regulator 2 [Artemisia annua]|uniref:Response regulator 2 n=1 Tax=Artemisia annua TaxID=35608 RepID=A0A2U1PG31_ARTAN|nr:response regulator 2 [Artemisia annua]
MTFVIAYFPWLIYLLNQLIDHLSVRASSPEVKLNILKEIANEHDLDWDPTESETELLKPHEDLLTQRVQHLGGMNTGFIGGPDVGFGSMSSLNGLDLQALAASGQLGQVAPQSLETLQAMTLDREIKGENNYYEDSNSFSWLLSMSILYPNVS